MFLSPVLFGAYCLSIYSPKLTNSVCQDGEVGGFTHQASQGQLIAIDGKTLRRSFDTATKKSAIHLVSAWAVENEVLLGQIKVDEKSNEITAVPKLLRMLMLKGAVVTLDAMGCQKENTKIIYKKGGDYVISLKGNQTTLHQEVKEFFEEQLKHPDSTIKLDTFESIEKGHGRIEVRKYVQTETLDWITAKVGWAGLKSIGYVTSTRIIGEKTSTETRYFISSLSLNAKRFGAAVRGHWAVENNLHWCLDVQMNEDQCRKRVKNAAQNFALLRRIALNLLKAEKTKKGSMKGRSKLTGWDHDYLLKVLLGPSPLATA
jgi:predicted transposase YbfD/YdcC